ncbi:kynureninase [Parvularcula sp. IMCC14364]|uniref:kynureninase n=1 Tax=Parvularcula sp. IMCC14364 TaxID=3067902 RepID=UPI0027413207|nr:kynureninase [Parvularcula sp. IMCC14364]
MQHVEQLDQRDPLRHLRGAFHLPEGIIYLDGNSLGPLPRDVSARTQRVVAEEWGQSLIKGWNDHDWIGLPQRVGNKIARLIGAPGGTVIAADSTSLNLLKVLSAALSLRPERKIILSDTGNFPTDLYMAQGISSTLGADHELKLVAPEMAVDAIDDTVAVLMLTEVDYRTGRKHDMAALTRRAHQAGVLTIWDLAHSAGAVPVDLTSAQADFAIGCGYKYLNGGPGAPAFVYVRPDHLNSFAPSLSGWMGHAAPFDFDLTYKPAKGIDRMLVGTPTILSMSALDSALDLWRDISMEDVRQKSLAMTDMFIAEVAKRCTDQGLELLTPREHELRGSQVSFSCPNGYAVMQALIAEGVIGDFRSPDIIRFGFTPLYLRYADVITAAETLARVLQEQLWDRPQFLERAKVT